MQLVASASIPKADGEIVLSRDRLKRLRKSGLPVEWFVFLAIQMQYSQQAPEILVSSFCEEWGLLDFQFDAAIAKLQKKGLLNRPQRIVQIELFGQEEQDA